MRSICLLVMIVLPGLASAQTEYFPLHSDAQWTYGGSPMEIARTMTLSAGADSAGTHAWSGPFGDQRVHLTEDGELYEVIDSGRRLLLDFGASEGTSWTIDATSDDLVSGSRVTVSARNQTKIVSFGTFEAVIHFEVIPPDGLRDAGLTDLWFAPKVGLIGYEEITVAGPQIYELAAFAIPGDDVVTLPTPQPVDPGNLFPASIGLTWTYVGPFDDERQIRILEVTTTGDDTALVLSGLMGDRTIRSTGNRIEQFSSEAWRLLFDLGALEDEFYFDRPSEVSSRACPSRRARHGAL